jgi:hypothetical protein
MSARAHPRISPKARARSAPRRGTAWAAALAAAFAAWALYATPPQRWPAYAALRPLVAAFSPATQNLRFGEVSARHGEINGQPVLYVEGSLVNSDAQRRKTPALRITLVGDDGLPVYSWTAKAAKPEMQASAEFRTRLLSPPEKFKSIAISFADAS